MAAFAERAKTSFVFVILLMTPCTGGRRFHLLVHALAVTGIAIQGLVPTIQLETSPSIMIKIPEFPISQAMTFLAFCAQSELMHIIFFMARVTGCRSLISIELPGMAPHTSSNAMLSNERVLRVSIMIKGNRFPVFLVMTFLALQSKIRSMNVVFLVTRMAVRRSLVLIESARMATVAFRLAMVPLQEVGRIPIMLKQHDFPVPLRMAPLAAIAISSFMCVVFLMTCITIDRGLPLIEVPFMARIALGQEMSPT